MHKIIKFLRQISIKTIYINFKYLPLSQAIKFPIMVSKNVKLLTTSGKLIFNCPIKTGLIQIGYGDVGIFEQKYSRSIWHVSGTIVFNGKCYIGHGSKISVEKNGQLTLGNNFAMSSESSIVVTSNVQFGNDCLLSWEILIMDTDSHKIKNQSGIIINQPQPIIIGNKVWICSRCTILKGTFIPNNTIIGANSTVSKKLEKENCIYAGTPCHIIKENINWEF